MDFIKKVPEVLVELAQKIGGTANQLKEQIVIKTKIERRHW